MHKMAFTFLLMTSLLFTLTLSMPSLEDEPTLDIMDDEAEPNLEQGRFLEGDIRVPHGRNGITNLRRRWINGVIPYTLDSDYNILDTYLIKEAIADYHKLTCLRWVPRTTEGDFVYFTKEDSGCWSYVGRMGGRQILNLQIPGCARKGTRLHEMMHAVGFWHEQSRADRDEHIRINMENVRLGRASQFRKVAPSISDPLGVAYDYGSVMHYPRSAFNRNGLPTITALHPLQGKVMGQRVKLSESDYWKINRMYNCTDYPRGLGKEKKTKI